MKKFICLMIIGCFMSSAFGEFSFDDITNWVGTGSNQAAMVVHWSSPEYFNLAYSYGGSTPMPAPIQEVSMVWGYRFDGTANAEDMMLAIAAADPQLYVYGDNPSGSIVDILGIGYDLDGDGAFGVSNGTTTYGPSDFVNGYLNFDSGAGMDADYDLPIDEDDLYWGGKLGPYWELWQESGGEGGFSAAPDRGEDTYWTGDSPRFESGVHGEWDYVATDIVISDLSLEDGSWVGWSVAAGGCDLYAFPPDDGTTAYFYNKQAPVLPAPEPMSLALMALGTVMLVRQRRS